MSDSSSDSSYGDIGIGYIGDDHWDDEIECIASGNTSDSEISDKYEPNFDINDGLKKLTEFSNSKWEVYDRGKTIKELAGEDIDTNNDNSKSSDKHNDANKLKTLLSAAIHGHIKQVRMSLANHHFGFGVEEKLIRAALQIIIEKVHHVNDVYGHILRLFLTDEKFKEGIKSDDSELATILHIAATCRTHVALRILLKSGILDINKQDTQRDTHIVKAIRLNRVNNVRLLLQQPGINISIKCRRGNTVLHTAVKEGYSDLVKLLLDHDVNGINTANDSGRSPLHTALGNKQEDIIKLLISYKECDINAVTQNNESPLILAARSENVNILRVLLEKGCNVNIKTRSSKTALFFAAEHRNTDIVKLLLDEPSCDINIPSTENETPLHRIAVYASSYDKNAHTIMRMFLSHPQIGKSLRTVNENGETVILEFLDACSKRYMWKECDYIKTSADILFVPEAILALPHTLATAVETASFSLCEQLVRRAPSCVNSAFPDHETALHCAIRIDSFPKCRLLVDNGADMSVRWNGQTALEYAISRGSSPLILSLLDSNISVTDLRELLKQNCFQDETPLQCSKRLGMEQWVSYFTDLPIEKSKRRKVEIDTPCEIQPNGNLTFQKLSWAKVKKYVSTDLQLDPRTKPNQFNNPLIPTHQLIFTCATPLTVKESREITKAAMTLAKTISSNIAKSADAHFEFRTLLSGSVHEGTKTFAPNEVDIVCDLIHTEALKCFYLVDEPDEAPIEAKADSPWAELCNEDMMLAPGKLIIRFYQILHREIQKLVNEGVLFGHLKLHPYSLKLTDKISCLQLLWQGPLFPGLIVYVDMVPCFFYHTVPGKMFDFVESNRYGRHAIAKCSRRHPESKVNFDISTSLTYRRIMNSLPRKIKQAYIVAKALRVSDVSYPGNMSTFNLNQTISSEDVITSYKLKITLLEILNDEYLSSGELSKEFFRDTVYAWADRIYAKLHDMTKAGKSFRANGTVENFEICSPKTCGPNDLPVINACCMKKPVVLSLCEQIRKWLRENRSILEHLAFGEHMVYSRTGTTNCGFFSCPLNEGNK